MPLSPPLCLRAYFQNTAVSGNDYTTVLTIEPQTYTASGPTQGTYNGNNVAVGMYATSNFYGIVFRITSITSQSSSSVTAVLEDIGGFNKKIDVDGAGNGAPYTGYGYIFELNADGLPALTAVNTSPTITFPDSIIGRFVYDRPITVTDSFCVAVGQGTNTLAYSADGTNWIGAGTSIFSTAGNRVAYNGSLWVATGTGTNSIATSPDGINWTGRSNSLSIGRGVAWNGSLWVVVGYGSTGTQHIVTSPDGITWTNRGIFFTASNLNDTTLGGYGIAWNGSIFVAGVNRVNNASAALIYTSNDGITWTPVASTVSLSIGICLSVAWNGSFFVAGTDGINSILSSPNGFTWTERFALYKTKDLAWNGQLWVGVGETASSLTITTSSNSTTWTNISNSSSLVSPGNAVAWNGKTWIVGGEGTFTLLSSPPSGTSWSPIFQKVFTTRVNGIASRYVLPFIGKHTTTPGIYRRLIMLEPGSATGPVLYQNNSSTSGMYFPATGAIAFSGSGVQSLIIDPNRNVMVGQGPTGPSTRLHVYNTASDSTHGNLCIENNNAFGFNTGLNVGNALSFKSRWQGDGLTPSVIMGKIDVAKEQNANYGDSYIAFSNRYEFNRALGGAGTLAEKMRISGNGAVGINTSNSVSRLVINDTSTGPSNAILLTNGSFNSTTRGTNAGVFSNEICGLSAMTTNGAGTDAGQLRLSAGGGSTANEKSYIDLYGYDSNFISFNTSGSERMRIGPSGPIGIGTTTPAHLLDVNGTIRGSGSIVNTWSSNAGVGTSWNLFTSPLNVISTTYTPKQTVTGSNTITLVIDAAVELIFNGGTGFDALSYSIVQGGTFNLNNFNIQWDTNVLTGRVQSGGNWFSTGIVTTTIQTATSFALRLTRTSGDDAAYYRNAYLVIYEISTT